MDEVRVGQIYESRDPRDWPRKVQVVTVFEHTALVRNTVTGKQTSIRLDRLRKRTGPRGFNLAVDA